MSEEPRFKKFETGGGRWKTSVHWLIKDGNRVIASCQNEADADMILGALAAHNTNAALREAVEALCEEAQGVLDAAHNPTEGAAIHRVGFVLVPEGALAGLGAALEAALRSPATGEASPSVSEVLREVRNNPRYVEEQMKEMM